MMETFWHANIFQAMHYQCYDFKNIYNFFTFASTIVARQMEDIRFRGVASQIRAGSYASRQYFSRIEWFGSSTATTEDLVAVWVLLVTMQFLSVLMFFIEILLNLVILSFQVWINTVIFGAFHNNLYCYNIPLVLARVSLIQSAF